MREYGSEHPAIVLPDGYFANLDRFGREITYLRSGREALLYVSLNCRPAGAATILMPAYCCWSMSAPFEKSGWRVVYYRLHDDLTIDEEYLVDLLGRTRPAAVLTMNFYGSASTARTVDLIKTFSADTAVIEDFSHCTFCLDRIFDGRVDYYVSSIRKSVGVCDGAIVLSKHPTRREYIGTECREFADGRQAAQYEKGRYAYTRDQEAKARFLSAIRACEHLIDEFTEVRPISDTAMRMLAQINGGEIAFARRENMRHLWSLLDGKVRLLPGLERSFGGAPFSCPILVEERDRVQRILAEAGVYAPVLWPLSVEARAVCPVSAYVADHMLSIPVDQRYGWDDMEDIAKRITACI